MNHRIFPFDFVCWAGGVSPDLRVGSGLKLNTAYGYVFDQNLAAGASATGPFPAYVVLTQKDGTLRQEKRVRLTKAPIDLLGYTLTQVKTNITDLGGTPA